MNNENSSSAFITGASAGIGAEFARRLAERGYNLILTARREERLKAQASKLSEQHNVKCEIVFADLSNENDTEKVASVIRETKDISMLVNNAGFGVMGNLHEAVFSRQIDMLNVHIVATVKLARAALENMVPNGRGDIINVSSVAAFFAVNLLPLLITVLLVRTRLGVAAVELAVIILPI